VRGVAREVGDGGHDGVVTVGQLAGRDMPLTGRVFRCRHWGAAVDAHHHAHGVFIRGNGKARRSVVSLVISRHAGVIA
ncbi:hypothetical protein FHD02_24285, partial [Citrobacter sp. EC_71]